MMVRRMLAECRREGFAGVLNLNQVRWICKSYQFDKVDRQARPPTHEIRFGGPSSGFQIVRLSDGKVIVQHLETEEDAKRHYAGMLRLGLA
jgi:hypothetical protein